MTARPNTAALYCRLSRRPSDHKVMGIAEQEADLREEAARRGLDVIGSYADRGISAYNGAERPGFTELLDALAAGGVGHVLVVALDRASRKVGDVAMLRDALEDADALLVAGGREYHPCDDALSMYLSGIVGEQESRDKSRRILGAKRKALQLGRFNGGRTPLAFDKENGQWKQRPAMAKAIRDSARMLLEEGKGLRAVVQMWNRRAAVRSNRGGPWTESKVQQVLLSPIVAGLRSHKGQVTGALTQPDGSAWPAILTPEEREQISRRLRARNARTPRGWHAPNPALLSALARCWRCGHTVNPRRYADGHRPASYTCGNRDCGGVGVSLAKLDDLITEAALYRLDSPAVHKALARPKRAARGENPAVIEDELLDLAGAAGRGDITVKEMLEARRPLDERLQRALAALDREDEYHVLTPIVRAHDVRKAWDALDFDGKRAVLAALIDSITIGPATSTARFDPDRINVIWRV